MVHRQGSDCREMFQRNARMFFDAPLLVSDLLDLLREFAAAVGTRPTLSLLERGP